MFTFFVFQTDLKYLPGRPSLCAMLRIFGSRCLTFEKSFQQASIRFCFCGLTTRFSQVVKTRVFCSPSYFKAFVSFFSTRFSKIKFATDCFFLLIGGFSESKVIGSANWYLYSQFSVDLFPRQNQFFSFFFIII